MEIDVGNRINIVSFDKPTQLETVKPVDSMTSSPPVTAKDDSTEITRTVNDAAFLLQLVTSKLSGAVIRNVSSSEYMQLLAILDRIVSGSVDKHV
ncbi:hypothetical protein BN59_02665 [Legionella massiliensis]|uniref:FlaG protein n=1 Tax=Legionella massiliensis TaxID=1034943 RepID=A0A078KV88_9GAMM|nr:hypothetical protein [Legionella massiliensis]CDZ78355.1 hypothetical protein BN59_02665 [Legionella massiliensis]CEE14093.1 hypothetical protein BN1094_02665 [Legionella massiliensis]